LQEEDNEQEADMLGGYMGKFLWVDLTTKNLREEIPDEGLLRDFIGGYGIGARILYTHIPAHIDPLGPLNILGFVVGPLTATPTPSGNRWTVVAKSPLTNGWGDANGGGFFGPALKMAGYDAVFFTGISEKPVYLYLDNGFAELRAAEGLWGLDTYETDDWVKENLGEDFEAACIGPSGENLSLISGIVNAKGRIAARSGLGAVMGSKRVKMVVARGILDVPLAQPNTLKSLRKKYVKEINNGVGNAQFFTVTGTPGATPMCIESGDSPVRNWRSSVKEFPDIEPLDFNNLLELRLKRKGCWKCPISCWGTSRVEYNGQIIESHQPEYETASAFGSMTVNNNYPSLIMAGHICNKYGLDTISAGSCVSFAIECFENGLIDLHDTGGIRLTWGDHLAMNAMLEKIARREDFGDVLADGVKRAAEKLGPRAVPFAIHIGGQELPMHDPRCEPGIGVIYKIDATPGRHSQGLEFHPPPDFPLPRPAYGENREQQLGRGHYVKYATCLGHTMNASNVCWFGFDSTNRGFIPEFISAVTGIPFSIDDMLLAGERIANIRQAFNVREGINPVTYPIPERAYGYPPLQDGPTAGLSVQIKQMEKEYLEDMDWTLDAAVPKPEVLLRLGLNDVAQDLWMTE
jgi:aldehyde:ferredoxin oxidoreductase